MYVESIYLVMRNFTFLFLLMASLLSFSQTKQNPWRVGIHIGSEQYNGDVENQFFNFVDHHNGFAGFSVSRYLSPHFDLATDLTLGDIKISQTESRPTRSVFNMNQANLHLKFNFFKYENVKFRPFLFAGLGYIAFDQEGNSDNTNYLALPSGGLGVNYKLNENVNIRYQNTLLVGNGDDFEGETDGSNDMFLQSSIGVSTVIKSTQDGDRDGVPDRKDQCPNTELGMKVDKFGCAVDLDLDGIPNDRDKCPSIPGFEYTNGCPDSDNDSIANADDPCPNIAGPINGCPDSDGDLVADKDDKCPDVAGLESLGGCPEEVIKEEAKRIGVFTYNDLPMENAALVVLDENGNPVDTIYTDGNGRFEFSPLDADKHYSLKPIDLDGSSDNVEIYLVDEDGKKRTTVEKDGKFVFEDATDDTADEVIEDKVIAKKEPKKEVEGIPSELLTDINFDSESFTIKIKYYDQLNRLAMALKKAENIRVDIKAYADSTGPEDYNQRLTDRRADRIERYLIRKGVPADRINAVGKGESDPIATNKTPEGRALNRRVEINLMD